VQHVFEKEWLGAPRTTVDREPDQLDGIAYRYLPAQIQVLELPAGVVDVVQDTYGGVILPSQRLEGVVVGMFALIECQGRRTLLQGFQHPVAHPHEGLDFILGVTHDLLQFWILLQ